MKKRLLYLLYTLLFFSPVTVLAQIANHVVISQIYGSGGNSGAVYTNDYVELYNPTGADVDMSTWSLQYQSAAGVSTYSGLMPFPAGAIIKSHGYYLVQLASGGSVGVALPVTADYIPLATNTTISFNMSGASGKVALCNSVTNLSGTPASTAASPPPLLVTTSIVDLVAYGTVNYNESYVLSNPAVPATASATGAAPGLTATTAVLRLANSASTATTMAIGGSDAAAGNGYDSNVNSTDLVSETVGTGCVPRNTASPIAPAGGAAPAPVLAVATSPVTSPTSINFGTAQTINTTSAPQSLTLTGTNLTAGATVTTTAPYAIATTAGGTYGTSISLTQAQAASQVIYVEFTPTTTTATTGSVNITTAGAIGQGVILTGTGTNVVITPSLTASTPTLTFGNVNEGLATPPVLSYTLSGANLGSVNTAVTAPAPYTLSKAAAGPFTASLSFTPTELAATPAPSIYVQFNPTVTGLATGNITNINSAVTGTNPTVTATGTGVVPVLTATTTPATTPTAIAYGNQTISTTATQTFVLTGANIVAGTTTAVTSGNAAYTVSKTSTGGYASNISFSSTELAAGPTVYVQFTPTALGLITTNIGCLNSGTGATTLNVGVSGTSVAAPVPLLSLNPTSLTFSATVNTTSAAQSYVITGANITGASSVTVAAPYSVSKTATGTYGSSVNYTIADFPSGSGTQTVYVEFTPTLVGSSGANTASAANATAGGTTQTLTLNGTGIGVPLLAATPTSLTFSSVIGTTTAAQTFSLTGSYLTAATTTVTVTAPYQVSRDGNTWGLTATYTSADFPVTGIAAATVYVRFSPTAIAVAGVNNGTAAIASTGATAKTVTLNGTGLGVPALTITAPATPPLAFGNQSISAASAPQAVTISGANITGASSITVTAPYTVSATATGTYSSTVNYLATDFPSGSGTQTVYVEFSPTAVGAANGTLTAISAGATQQTLALTGTGIPPPNVAPTLNAIADVTTCFTAAAQTIALSGISPGPETTQTVIVSVSSSNPSLFANLGVLPLTATTAQLNYAFATGANGSAVITVTVHDNGGTANGGIDTYTRTFNVTVGSLAVVNITASNGGAPLEKGQTVTLTATGGTSYLWTANGDITGPLNGASITVRPGTLAGSPPKPSVAPYTYTVTATNATGCTTTQTYTVTTFNARKLVTSNIITPNGDGINDTWVILNIELYPENNVKVFDKSGKIVFTQSGYLNTWDGSYNGAPLTQGTYTYVIDLGGGVKYSGYISIVR